MQILETLAPDRCHIVDAIPSGGDCRQLSAEWRCKLWRGGYYLTRGRGNKPGTVYLTRKALNGTKEKPQDGILPARAAVQTLTGYDDPGWTYSQLARKVTEWLAIRQAPLDRVRQMLPAWHFQKAIPCYSRDARLFDISAAYWQMVERAPSPTFELFGERIAWHAISVQQESRWQRMKSDLKPYKRLRLAIVGCNATGWKCSSSAHVHGTECYRNGRSEQQAGRYCGPLQPLSLLAVRGTFEITQIQTEACDSLYSNADCCMTESAERMAMWDALGIDYKLKASGPAEVRGIGAWKCGNRQTDPFVAYHHLEQRPFIGYRFAPSELVWHERILGISVR